MANNWTIVGISGATCSGKTSLVTNIASAYPGSILMQQDDYFWDKFSDHHVIIKELNHQNWECLQSLDWESMMRDIHKLLKTDPPSKEALFLVEGHIIFNYPDLEKLFDKKYFITLNEEVCFERRNRRVYDPPDCPGYFELCIWPMYLSNLADVKNKCSSIVYLDGTQSIEKIFETVANDLTHL